MTKFFWVDGKSVPVEFKCETEKSCPYTPRMNDRCKQCVDFKVKLNAVDFYKMIKENRF